MIPVAELRIEIYQSSSPNAVQLCTANRADAITQKHRSDLDCQTVWRQILGFQGSEV